MSSFSTISLSATARERAMLMYIHVTVSLYLPTAYVDNKKFRDFGRIDDVVSIKAF